MDTERSRVSKIVGNREEVEIPTILLGMGLMVRKCGDYRKVVV